MAEEAAVAVSAGIAGVGGSGVVCVGHNDLVVAQALHLVVDLGAFPLLGHWRQAHSLQHFRIVLLLEQAVQLLHLLFADAFRLSVGYLGREGRVKDGGDEHLAVGSGEGAGVRHGVGAGLGNSGCLGHLGLHGGGNLLLGTRV